MRAPLYVQVLLGAAVGTALGLIFGERPFLFGLSNHDLGQVGTLVIRLLKSLAAPLILLAILDAFARTDISARQAGRLFGICLLNVSVACTIGLLLMNVLRPGDKWQGQTQNILNQLPGDAPREAPSGVSLDPIKNLSHYVPESLVEPFLTNNIISIVLAGVLAGAALRRVKQLQHERGQTSVRVLEQIIEAGFQLLLQVLEWVVRAVPLAVLGTIAFAVGKSGLKVFELLAPFLFIILLGLAIHALLYYPLLAWTIGRKHPRVYLGQGADAIVTGLSCNSSLATVPVTLRCLTEKMGVSETSARLATCIGTNLNNDGITLYEAMAALFLAQAMGLDLSLPQQLGIIVAAIMAGIGVAGVPEAGLIVLPLVLGAAGLPEAVVLAAIPLILPVDWILARCRSGVNVMSDMVVAILLDAGERRSGPVAVPLRFPEVAEATVPPAEVSSSAG